MAAQRKLLYAAQTEAVNLQDEARREELVDADELKILLGELVQVFGGSLDDLGSDLAPKLAGVISPAVIKELIDDRTRQARQAVYEQIQSWVVTD